MRARAPATLAVFVGPSLPPIDRVARPGVTYLPPAARDDVAHASEAFDALLLVDGVFHHDLAPSPKEVLAACERRSVFGAASMGALRAAECRAFGMVPLGAIARWYAREVIDGDDEVAVLMHPRTHAALSVPSVNVRYVAWLAVRRGLLARTDAAVWIARARGEIFYADRTWEDALARAPREARAALACIAEREGDLKRWDARFALRRVLRLVAADTRVAADPHAGAKPVQPPKTISPTRLIATASPARPPANVSPRADAWPPFAHTCSALPGLPATLPKAPGSFDRHAPLAATLARVPALRERFGITRVADLTHLDRAGIPVLCAVVPRSPDRISVYNGKGLTRDHALASAIMEAVERQCAAAPQLAVETFDPDGRDDVVHPGEFGGAADVGGRVLPFVCGRDLTSGKPRWIPLQAVRSPWCGERAFPIVGSNGLAAGNDATEAIYHALCELLERHVWSMAHARAHVRPRRMLETLLGRRGGTVARDMVDDPAGDRIAFPTGRAAVDEVERRLTGAGLSLRVLALREAGLPPVACATLWEPHAAQPTAHFGIGASLSPEHAVLRAMTEAAQSRLVDIAGAREDLVRADDASAFEGEHGRRLRHLPYGRWYFDAPCGTIALDALEDRSQADLAVELATLASAVHAAGRRPIAVVDLAPPASGVSVVRVVVPRLESATVTGRIGEEIAAVLNENGSVARLSARPRRRTPGR